VLCAGGEILTADLLEEQRRAGAFVWINRYSLLARVTDEFPPRLTVVDRRTEH